MSTRGLRVEPTPELLSHGGELLKRLGPGLRLEDPPARQFFGLPPEGRVLPAVLDAERVLLDVRPQGLYSWQTLRELRGLVQLMYPSQVRNSFTKRARFMYRALSNFSVWRRWHGFLGSSPFGEIAVHFPRLYEKPLRPYLHKDLMRAEVLRVLREHYLFLQHRAPGAFVESLLKNRPFLLNERSIASLDVPLLLNLTYARHMQQEGELTLSIGLPDSVDTLHDHRWISALTFLLQYGASGWEILVGGVQGGHSEKSKEDIKAATHCFHGFRPKHLLVHLLREIAATWGISRIYAIGDEAHCLRCARYRGRIEFKSSYDELWMESDGQPVANGFYSLPIVQHRRPLEDVPSRKRSQYRKRYALMDSVDAEIRDKLRLITPVPVRIG